MGVISQITLKDNYTNTANKVVGSMQKLDRTMNKAEKSSKTLKNALSSAFNKTYEVKIKDVKSKKIRTDIQKMQSELRKSTGKPYNVSITTKTSMLSKLTSGLDNLSSKAKNIKLGVTGQIKAFAETKKLSRELTKATGKKHKIKISLDGDKNVSSKLDGIKNKLSGLGAGIGGALKVGGAAILAGGAAAVGGGLLGAKALWNQGSDLEAQKTSMTHFLGGDEKASADYLGQLRTEANKTPFGTSEVISAGTRAIQIAEGDTGKGMELVKMAEDMAALTPGKTISDAMEALADMQMGEMERMKEFGFKGSKELFDKAGGDITKMKSTSGKTIGDLFTGGAEKLSHTGRGKWETIKGNVSSGIADAGLKMLERLSPVLSKLIPISEKIGTVVPKVFDKVVSGLEVGKDKVTGAFEIIKGAFARVSEVVSPYISMVKSALMPVIENVRGLIEAFIPKIQEIVTAAIPLFKGAIEVVGGIIKNLVVPAFSIIGSIINHFFKPALEIAGDIISNVVVPAMKTLHEILTNVVVPVLDELGSFITGVVAPAFDKIAGVISNLVTPIFEAVVGVVEKVVNLFKDLVGAVSGVLDAFSGIGGKISEKLNTVWDFIKPSGNGTVAQGNANGTSYFPGGRTKINERGEELIDLPRGSRIFPAGKTMDIISKEVKNNSNTNNNSSPMIQNNTFNIYGGDPKDNANEIERRLKRLAVNV